jgi:type II secretion system protein G
MPCPIRRRGFTLLELTVVIAILGLLAGVVVPRVASRLASTRDVRRLQDIHALRDAIEQYRLDTGAYPAPNSSAAWGGWDVSHDGDFVNVLRLAGYLQELPADPINDDTYHYRYYVYAAGAYSCAGPTSFYVLGIKRFETDAVAARNTGYFQCSGRNWNDEFAFVTGGGASFQ